MSQPPLAVFIAPCFLIFEVVQLVLAERLVGVKQIEAGVDPRETCPSEPVAAFWVAGIVAEASWLAWLLFAPPARIHAACLLLVTLVGFALRSHCALKRVLVILTVEGALRIGLMVSMLGAAWKAL